MWKGSAFGGARGRADVPKIVGWYMKNRISINDLITHCLSLEQINDGFDLMKPGESIRSVVKYQVSVSAGAFPGLRRFWSGP